MGLEVGTEGHTLSRSYCIMLHLVILFFPVRPQGLTHNEVRLLAENVHDQPEHHDDRAKRAEFSLPTWLVLNALEVMGFKVGLGRFPNEYENQNQFFT